MCSTSVVRVSPAPGTGSRVRIQYRPGAAEAKIALAIQKKKKRIASAKTHLLLFIRIQELLSSFIQIVLSFIQVAIKKDNRDVFSCKA